MRRGAGRFILAELGALLLAVAAAAQSQPASQPAASSAPAESQPQSRPASAPASMPSRSAGDAERLSELSGPELSPKALQKALDDLEQSKLDEATRNELAALYRETLQEVNRGLDFSAKAADYTLRVHSADDDLVDARAELEQPVAELEVPINAQTPSAAAQRALTQAESELNDLQAALDELDKEQQSRAERRLTIPGLVTAARSRAEAAADPDVAGAAPSVVQARRMLRAARQMASREEISALDAELAAYDARAEILVARRDLAARRVSQQKKLVAAIRSVLQEIRQAEKEQAERQAQEARERAARAHPAIAALLRENADLTQEKIKLGEQMDAVSAALQRTQAEVDERVAEGKRLREILGVVGQPTELGQVLRAARNKLRSVRDFEREIRADQKDIARHQVRRFQLAQISADLALPDDEVAAALSKLDANADAGLRERIETAVREQLAAKKKTVDELLIGLDKCVGDLTHLSQKRRALQSETITLTELINEHILWIQSLQPIGIDDISKIQEGLERLRQPRLWQDTYAAFLSGARNALPEVVLGVLALVVLIVGHGYMRSDLHNIRDRVGRPSTDSFRDTLRAVVWTALLAAPGPLLLQMLSLTLLEGTSLTDFQRALAAGLQRSAITWYVLSSMRNMARRNGLGEVHFRIRPEIVRTLRRTMNWMMPLVPLAGLSLFLGRAPDDLGLKPISRVIFMTFSALVAGFVAYLFRPRGAILARFLEQSRGGWLDRLRYIWYPSIVALPLLMLGLAASGYFYTAVILQLRAQTTWILLISLIILHLLVMRWLLVAARRLALDKAEAQAKSRAEKTTASDGAAAQSVVLDSPELTAGKISAQTRQLLRTLIGLVFVIGMWWNWSDTMPALRFLENYKVLDADVVTQAPAANGEPRNDAAAAPTGAGSHAVTLADCMAAAVALICTIALAKNIPGVLEITILQRLPLEPSARYAITTICSYAITIIGLIASFGALGIGWSKVQWLAAAVTFGLGFGLQEIFANFVSGLILLFERPIRLGDIVTVGDISGTVSRIRIRATTITDADRRDLIVPNKEFIVGRFINWTLTDDMLRIVIPVGVAFGATVNAVLEILNRAATMHPDVARDPAPQAFFLGFSQDALKFELRMYVASPSDSSKVQNDVSAAIYLALQQADIALARPMRDIRLHASDLGSTTLAAGTLPISAPPAQPPVVRR